jgi:hypothetical protein
METVMPADARSRKLAVLETCLIGFVFLSQSLIALTVVVQAA